MNIYNVKLEQFQMNSKFSNTLPPEWSKFVTNVKSVRDLHTANIDQLHAYLAQHEFHANEVRLMHERNSDSLALVATHQITQGNSVSNQSSPNFDPYFELNELKAQSQEKDMVIRKLKERIKSLSGNINADKGKWLIIAALRDELRKLKGKALVDNHSKLNANSKLLCVKCNGCMHSDNHDLCVLNIINDVIARLKSKSVKITSKEKF
nr:hypothetical protein [Tanacetum cinerariifolium]